jgi:hypothetical protein
MADHLLVNIIAPEKGFIEGIFENTAKCRSI